MVVVVVVVAIVAIVVVGVQKLWHFVKYLLLLKIFTRNSEYVFTIQKVIHIFKGDNSKCLFSLIMPLFRPRLFIKRPTAERWHPHEVLLRSFLFYKIQISPSELELECRLQALLIWTSLEFCKWVKLLNNLGETVKPLAQAWIWLVQCNQSGKISSYRTV